MAFNHSCKLGFSIDTQAVLLQFVYKLLQFRARDHEGAEARVFSQWLREDKAVFECAIILCIDQAMKLHEVRISPLYAYIKVSGEKVS